jgi:hypothetical protein
VVEGVADDGPDNHYGPQDGNLVQTRLHYSIDYVRRNEELEAEKKVTPETVPQTFPFHLEVLSRKHVFLDPEKPP